MPSNIPAPKPAKRVTKSIRLTPDEATDLAQLVAGTAYAEAALLRQWVLAGMQQFRVAEAIGAYQDGHMDIRQAAAQAHLPVATFLDELTARKVALVDQPDAFGPGLEALREAFGTEPEGSVLRCLPTGGWAAPTPRWRPSGPSPRPPVRFGGP